MKHWKNDHSNEKFQSFKEGLTIIGSEDLNQVSQMSHHSTEPLTSSEQENVTQNISQVSQSVSQPSQKVSQISQNVSKRLPQLSHVLKHISQL